MRRYWTLPQKANGRRHWVVIAESLHHVYRAVVIRDGFVSEQAAMVYIREVTEAQHRART